MGAEDEESQDELAHTLYDRWKAGEKKSRLEIEVWGDATAHGRRFDRFVRQHLGVSTTRPSKQTDQIAELRGQIKRLGALPTGGEPESWEVQLQHARGACLAALRHWNDPAGQFRTSAFALMFVTAWNALAIAVLQKSGGEWRKLDDAGDIVRVNGTEQALDTPELSARAFPGESITERGLRENIKFWTDLRNCVAHRHLPQLDLPVIPHAQAGLMNFESVVVEMFGPEYALAESLTVPLQLSGFRDPGILASRKALQAGLPLDVQTLLDRGSELDADVANSPTFQMRVAFLPVVPASGKGADAVAYFVKPGELSDELDESLQKYVVLPKIWKGGRWFRAGEVAAEVQRRTGFKFAASPHHSNATVNLGVRPATGEAPRTCDIAFAEYVSSFKQYQYTQAWIDRLAELCADTAGFEATTGRPAVPAPAPG